MLVVVQVRLFVVTPAAEIIQGKVPINTWFYVASVLKPRPFMYSTVPPKTLPKREFWPFPLGSVSAQKSCRVYVLAETANMQIRSKGRSFMEIFNQYHPVSGLMCAWLYS